MRWSGSNVAWIIWPLATATDASERQYAPSAERTAIATSTPPVVDAVKSTGSRTRSRNTDAELANAPTWVKLANAPTR